MPVPTVISKVIDSSGAVLLVTFSTTMATAGTFALEGYTVGAGSIHGTAIAYPVSPPVPSSADLTAALTPGASPTSTTGDPLLPWATDTSPAGDVINTSTYQPVRLVSWEELADQARIDDDGEQELVERMIDAATDYAEEAMGCTLVARNRVMVFRDGEPMRLRWGPTLSVVSVLDGNEAPFTDFELRQTGKLEIVHPNSSILYPVTVTYRAGYESAADVPASILQAIRMHAASLYKVRESVMDKALVSVPQTLEDFYRLKSWRLGIA